MVVPSVISGMNEENSRDLGRVDSCYPGRITLMRSFQRLLGITFAPTCTEKGGGGGGANGVIICQRVGRDAQARRKLSMS